MMKKDERREKRMREKGRGGKKEKSQKEEGGEKNERLAKVTSWQWRWAHRTRTADSRVIITVCVLSYSSLLYLLFYSPSISILYTSSILLLFLLFYTRWWLVCLCKPTCQGGFRRR